jgi:hypothetical protein
MRKRDEMSRNLIGTCLRHILLAKYSMRDPCHLIDEIRHRIAGAFIIRAIREKRDLSSRRRSYTED